jgi:hypothetical protein
VLIPFLKLVGISWLDVFTERSFSSVSQSSCSPEQPQDFVTVIEQPNVASTTDVVKKIRR